MRIYNIKWDTDDFDPEECGLPMEVSTPSLFEDEIADWLSDKYGFLVESFETDLITNCVCRNCKYFESGEDDLYFCNNINSENFGEYTGICCEDPCDDFEEIDYE